MSKLMHVCTVALMSAAAGAALAAIDVSQLPRLKSGLWVTTSAQEGMKPTTHRMCVDEATQQRLLTMGQMMAAGLCAASDLRRDGDAIVFDSDCSFGPMRVKSTARTTFDGATAYRSESVARFDPPLMGKSTVRSKADGKHVGACPTGMNPGDIKLPDGRVVNIDNLPGLMTPR